MLRCCVLAAALLALLPASAAAAGLTCPLLSDGVVAQLVGSSVEGGLMTDPFNPNQPLDTGPYRTACLWDSDAGDTVLVTRQLGAFAAGVSPEDLARQTTDQQLQDMREAGVPDARLPTTQISSVQGLGDAAAFLVTTDPGQTTVSCTVIVQRGADAFTVAVDTDSEAIGAQQATLLAQALLAGSP